MSTNAVRRRVLERLDRIGGARLDDKAVRREALAALGDALPFDAWAWAISDPGSHLAASALAEHPFEQGMLDLLRAEEDPAEVNRRSALARAGVPAAALGIATQGHPERRRRWRAQLSVHGISDELRIVFADRTGCWGYLDLYASGRFQYGEEEVALAQSIATLMTPTLRRAVRPRSTAQTRPETRDPAVLIIDEPVRVRARTGPAAQWLPQLRSDSDQPLPCAVLAATARASEARADSAAVVREQCADGQWATVRAAPLDTGGVAVTIEHSTPREVLDYLARAVALTRREREVLTLLFRGDDTRAVADTLVIEPGTVQDHVKSILTKTGYPTRRELLAGVVTTGADH